MAILISELLDSLPESAKHENLSDWCKELCKYYEENDRHSYAEITEYIFRNKGGMEYVRSLLPLLKFSVQGVQTRLKRNDRFEISDRVAN